MGLVVTPGFERNSRRAQAALAAAAETAGGLLLGNLAHFVTLSNIQLGSDGAQLYRCAQRFYVARSGICTGFRTVFINRNSGYAAGTGGNIRCDLMAVGSTGYGVAPILATTNHLNGNVPTYSHTKAVEAKVWATPVVLTPGHYWIQLENIDADPVANWVSLDCGRRQRRTAQQDWQYNMDCQVFWNYGGDGWRTGDGSSAGGSQQDYNLESILELHWSDGTVTSHPSSYTETAPWLTGNALGTHTGLIGGANRLRQTWTPAADTTLKGVRLHVGRVFGDAGTGPLIMEVKRGTMVLDLAQVSAAAIPYEPDVATYYSVGAADVDILSAKPRVFPAGVQATFEFSAPSGTLFRSCPLRGSTDYGFAASGVIPGGQADYSTNSGGTWSSGWLYGGQPNALFDLMLKLIRAG